MKLKKILTILLLTCITLASTAQVYKIEKVNNYLVVTDTTNDRLNIQYPASEVRFEETGNSIKLFGENDRKIGNNSYNIDSLVNSADTGFYSLANLRAFLRENTGGAVSASSSGSSTTSITSLSEELTFDSNKIMSLDNRDVQDSSYSFTLASSGNVAGNTIYYYVQANGDSTFSFSSDFNILDASITEGGTLTEDVTYLLAFLYDGSSVSVSVVETDANVYVDETVFADADYYNTDFSATNPFSSENVDTGLNDFTGSFTMAVKFDITDGQPAAINVAIGITTLAVIYVGTSGVMVGKVKSDESINTGAAALANGAVSDVKIVLSYDSSTGATILNYNGTDYTDTKSTGNTSSGDILVGGTSGLWFSGSIHTAAVWKGTAKNSSEIASIISLL